MKDKYLWWGLLGIGVAFFLWYLTSKQISEKQQPVNVPYLVPQTLNSGASPTASTTLSEQSNIVGNHPNSDIVNGTNPNNPANFAEFPGQFSTMPQLGVQPPVGVSNNVNAGAFFTNSQTQ